MGSERRQLREGDRDLTADERRGLVAIGAAGELRDDAPTVRASVEQLELAPGTVASDLPRAIIQDRIARARVRKNFDPTTHAEETGDSSDGNAAIGRCGHER